MTGEGQGAAFGATSCGYWSHHAPPHSRKHRRRRRKLLMHPCNRNQAATNWKMQNYSHNDINNNGGKKGVQPTNQANDRRSDKVNTLPLRKQRDEGKWERWGQALGGRVRVVGGRGVNQQCVNVNWTALTSTIMWKACLSGQEHRKQTHKLLFFFLSSAQFGEAESQEVEWPLTTRGVGGFLSLLLLLLSWSLLWLIKLVQQWHRGQFCVSLFVCFYC